MVVDNKKKLLKMMPFFLKMRMETLQKHLRSCDSRAILSWLKWTSNESYIFYMKTIMSGMRAHEADNDDSGVLKSFFVC